MSEEFESLDAAAVAGAQGWPSVLLSPIDVFATGMHDFDDLLKPPNVAPSSLGVPLATPPAATTTPKPIVITATSNNTASTITTNTATARAQARHALPVAKKVALKPKNTMNATTADNNNNSMGTSSIIASAVVDFAHMVDIGGTTAARSRQMSDEERRVMLYKRKLRNRASAARSREKRCRTITELANEVAALLDRSKLLDHRAILLQQENHRIQQENIQLRANNQRLRAILEAAGHTAL